MLSVLPDSGWRPMNVWLGWFAAQINEASL
jgi:hypothetical protein